RSRRQDQVLNSQVHLQPPAPSSPVSSDFGQRRDEFLPRQFCSKCRTANECPWTFAASSDNRGSHTVPQVLLIILPSESLKIWCRPAGFCRMATVAHSNQVPCLSLQDRRRINGPSTNWGFHT